MASNSPLRRANSAVCASSPLTKNGRPKNNNGRRSTGLPTKNFLKVITPVPRGFQRALSVPGFEHFFPRFSASPQFFIVEEAALDPHLTANLDLWFAGSGHQPHDHLPGHSGLHDAGVIRPLVTHSGHGFMSSVVLIQLTHDDQLPVV